MFLPGLLAENRDGNGSLPRSRNLISEKVLTRPSTLYGRGRADIHHGPESMTPLKAEYISADQLPLFVFRLQLCGGPYIPIRLHPPLAHGHSAVRKVSFRKEGRSQWVDATLAQSPRAGVYEAKFFQGR